MRKLNYGEEQKEAREHSGVSERRCVPEMEKGDNKRGKEAL